MSTYPQPVLPVYPVRPPRPGSLTAIAIVGIILGGLMILCSAPGVVMNAMGTTMQFGPTPAPQPTPDMRFWGLVMGLLSLVVWVWLLIGSIGSLNLRPWARRTMIYCAIVQL